MIQRIAKTAWISTTFIQITMERRMDGTMNISIGTAMVTITRIETTITIITMTGLPMITHPVARTALFRLPMVPMVAHSHHLLRGPMDIRCLLLLDPMVPLDPMDALCHHPTVLLLRLLDLMDARYPLLDPTVLLRRLWGPMDALYLLLDPTVRRRWGPMDALCHDPMAHLTLHTDRSAVYREQGSWSMLSTRVLLRVRTNGRVIM